ncbi:unnamed protein product [Soboliphyme baturini]|uniref:Uncharacterized protein n=1 Tax=Soboliphyme baturini TaxID=241478 RepID=A0A183J8K4_9BILA|nr:unnamed protein product [Soboliphyme baturini]
MQQSTVSEDVVKNESSSPSSRLCLSINPQTCCHGDRMVRDQCNGGDGEESTRPSSECDGLALNSSDPSVVNEDGTGTLNAVGRRGGREVTTVSAAASGIKALPKYSSRHIKLSRSGSDSSVSTVRRVEPFRRNIPERRSLRAENASDIRYKMKIEHRDSYRTSVDIEVDLQSAKLKLEQEKEQLSKLRDIKASLQQLKNSGVDQLPLSTCVSAALCEPVQRIFCGSNATENLITDCLSSSSSSMPDKRAMTIIEKSAHRVRRLLQAKQQKPPVNAFR